MHWDLGEVLAVIAGGAFMVTALALSEAEARARIQILLAGVLLVGYGIFMAGQTSGIFFIPVVAIALGLLAPLFLYFQAREKRARSAIPSLAPGTPGARHCLGCGRAYPADTIRSCPACRGTLAPPSSSTTKREE